MIKVLQIKFTRVQHSRVKTLQDNRAKHCKKQPNCHCNTWETIPSSTCNTWETIPSRRAAVEHIAAATTRLCLHACFLSSWLRPARGPRPKGGPGRTDSAPRGAYRVIITGRGNRIGPRGGQRGGPQARPPAAQRQS